MADQGVQIDGDKLCCSICLDLLNDPVTIPCGHSYCRDCIKIHWDGQDQKHIHTELVEELKETGLYTVPADHCYPGPGDVACDVCSGRKLKAIKSCLQYLVSYCEQHLQPHHNVDALKKHKLVDPSEKLQDTICSRHNEVMKIFCRTDNRCICYTCSIDEHKAHETVPASNRKKDVNLHKQEVEAINQFADKAVRDTEKIFSELILLIEKRSSDMKQQIRVQQETEINRVNELLEELEEELNELKRKDTELEKLSHTEDHTQFLNMFPLLSDLNESSESRCPTARPLLYFGDVPAAVSEVKDKLQGILQRGWQKVFADSD
uniref:B box-type domain-containing protein n=1 Tax=Pundamilia nyererei TaxID=303518 RepID=A0A3B4GHX0_9CICH